MYSENAFIDSQPKFLNLTLFICQLFIGDNFRIAQILYHPMEFDDRLIHQIDSECSLYIPKIFIDVTTVGNHHHLDTNKRTDHILQVILLSQEQSTEYFHRINEMQTFYRVFVISTKHELNFDQNISKRMHSLTSFNSSSLYLTYCPTLHGTFRTYHSSRDSNGETVFQEKIFNSSSEYDLFSDALGRNAFIQNIGAHYVDEVACYFMYKEKFFPNVRSQMIFANLYYLQMNLSFLDATKLVCGENAIAFQHKWEQIIPNRVYKEMSKHFELLDMQLK